MPLQVEIVSADRKVWEGEATQVSARSIDGDLGILPGHTPILCVLDEGEVRVNADGSWRSAQIDGGFLSVDHDRVTIIAESVDASGSASAAAIETMPRIPVQETTATLCHGGAGSRSRTLRIIRGRYVAGNTHAIRTAIATTLTTAA